MICFRTRSSLCCQDPTSSCLTYWTGLQTPPTLHAMSTKLAQKNLERVTEGRRRVVAMTMKLDDWRKAIRPQPIAILANSIRSSTMTKRQSDLILWCAAADATWEELHASSRWQMPRICGRCVAMSVQLRFRSGLDDVNAGHVITVFHALVKANAKVYSTSWPCMLLFLVR